MVVLEPVQITLTNLSDGYVQMITVPSHPPFGERRVLFTRTLYIDASDFWVEEDANFYCLSPGKSVALLCVPLAITTQTVICDTFGKVIVLFTFNVH